MNVVDFDETLIKKNSFPLWIFFLLHEYACRDIKKFVTVLLFLLLRKMNIYSHLTFKKKLMIIADDDELNEKFLISLFRYENSQVTDIIKNESNIVISAAPASYLKFLPKYYPCIKSVYATTLVAGELDSLFGKRKVEILEHSMSIDRVFTDDISDLPLLLLAKRAYLVNPNKSTLIALKENTLTYEIIEG